ncbi:MAG: HAD family hydrolase, partial [Deltaproteobacteria bacterium]|nr:HAD family hydrolase [Deltaproteobacteria bacterium]
LGLAASLERGSEHPLAAAIVAAAQEKNIPLSEASDFKSLTGKGISGTVDGKTVALGNQRLLEDLKVTGDGFVPKAEELRKDGQTVMFVVVDGKVQG